MLSVVAAALVAAGTLALVSPAASAASHTLYAAAAASESASCASPATACTLTTALTKVAAGDTIDLVTVGVPSEGATYYRGQFTVDTTGTSVSSPVAIVGPSGGAILDGNGEDTQLINGADFLTLSHLTFQDGAAYTPGLTNDEGGTVSVSSSTFHDEIDGAIDNADIFGAGVGGGTIIAVDDTFESDSVPDPGDNGGAINNVDGTVVVTGSTFDADSASGGEGGAIANGVGDGDAQAGVAGTLTVTDSSFTNDDAGSGGAIDNGDGAIAGTATLTDDAFIGDIADSHNGGAIVNGSNYGTGTMTITGTTFAQNSANDGVGAGIENGENSGIGTLTVLHTSFALDSSDGGQGIDNENGGTGAVTVGADLFGDGCSKGGGTWDDLGYNVGDDATCFGSLAATTTDVDGGPAVASDLSVEAQYNPNVVALIPTAGSPAVGAIPRSASAFCPVAADERGIPSPSDGPCDAGAIQDPPGATVLLTAAPLSGSSASFTAKVQGVFGLVPNGDVTISDGKGGHCTTPALVRVSKASALTAASCSIKGETAAHAPYTVTATYDGHDHPYGTSSATLVQSADVANSGGVAKGGVDGVGAKAYGGRPGKDSISVVKEKKNPNPVALSGATSYYDVGTSKDATFTKVTIEVCTGVTKSGDLAWWNPAKAKKASDGDGWQKVIGTSKPVVTKSKNPCASVSLDAATSPDLKQLHGTSFAARATPLRVSKASLLLTSRVRRFGRITLLASGGNSPYSWKFLSGNLPPGLKLSTGGVLSGTPTTAGIYLFTVQVHDTSTKSYSHQTIETKLTDTVST